MGYLEGLLGGFTARKGEVERQNREDAALAQQREDKIVQALINSPDPEVQSHGIAAMLDSASPKRRKGGLAGWVGEVASNPHLDTIRAIVESERGRTLGPTTAALQRSGIYGIAPPPPEPPPQSGQVSQAPTTAAQPATSPTVGGPPPAVEPVPPTPAAVPAPSMDLLARTAEGAPYPAAAAGPAVSSPPTATAAVGGPPPAPSAAEATGVGGGAPPLAVLGQPTPPVMPTPVAPPAQATGEPTPSPAAVGRRARSIFRSPEENTRLQSVAKAQGDVEGDIAGYMAAGMSRADAIKQVQAERIRRGAYGAGAGYQAVPGEVLDATGKAVPTFATFDRASGQFIGADPYSEHYGIPIPGFRPRATGSSLSPEAAAARAAAVATARGGAMAAVPLTTEQRFQATQKLATDWQKLQAPLREMERQHQLMVTGLKRFNEGDKIGGSQAVLVTFQKILDPTSVVRESEYARSGQGLGLAQRIEGFIQRLQEGGAGVPPEELAGMVETGRQFLQGMEGWNAQQRSRIEASAQANGLDQLQIFGPGAGGVGAPPPAAAPPGSGVPPTAAPPRGGAGATPPAAAAPAPSGVDQQVPGLFIDAQGNYVTAPPAAPARPTPPIKPVASHAPTRKS